MVPIIQDRASPRPGRKTCPSWCGCLRRTRRPACLHPPRRCASGGGPPWPPGGRTPLHGSGCTQVVACGTVRGESWERHAGPPWAPRWSHSSAWGCITDRGVSGSACAPGWAWGHVPPATRVMPLLSCTAQLCGSALASRNDWSAPHQCSHGCPSMDHKAAASAHHQKGSGRRGRCAGSMTAADKCATEQGLLRSRRPRCVIMAVACGTAPSRHAGRLHGNASRARAPRATTATAHAASLATHQSGHAARAAAPCILLVPNQVTVSTGAGEGRLSHSGSSDEQQRRQRRRHRCWHAGRAF